MQAPPDHGPAKTRCVECGRSWLPDEQERWRAYLGGDDLNEPAEVALFCPDCADREFKDS